jgi:hypothetical protein
MRIVGLLLAAAQAASGDADYTRCRLELQKERFAVDCPSRRVDGPIEWLMPPAEVDAETDNYVSSFAFGPDAAAIPIGRGFIAFHLASYEMMKEGSAAAAAGRDVFLILDPATGTLRPAGPSLGLTRERLRADGCFRALNHRFFLADINEDGLLDLGVLREELVCRLEDSRENPGDSYSRGPFDCPQPVRWYVVADGQWTAAPKHDGLAPADQRELPLLGITRSPVDFLKSTHIRIEPCPSPSRTLRVR